MSVTVKIILKEDFDTLIDTLDKDAILQVVSDLFDRWTSQSDGAIRISTEALLSPMVKKCNDRGLSTIVYRKNGKRYDIALVEGEVVLVER